MARGVSDKSANCSWLELDVTHGLHWIPVALLPTSDLGFLSLLTLSRIASNEHAKWGTKGREEGLLGEGKVWERVTVENIKERFLDLVTLCS